MGKIRDDGSVILVRDVVAAHRKEKEAASFKVFTEVEALGDFLEQHEIDGANLAKMAGLFVVAYGMSQSSGGQESKHGGSGER